MGLVRRTTIEMAKRILPFGFLLSSCVLPTAAGPNYIIETVSTACMTRQAKGGIEAIQDAVIITHVMTTPNPCYLVTGEVEIDKDEIAVRLQPKNGEGVCIQCIGEVVARVKITGLKAGTYLVRLDSPSGSYRDTVKVSGASK